MDAIDNLKQIEILNPSRNSLTSSLTDLRYRNKLAPSAIPFWQVQQVVSIKVL